MEDPTILLPPPPPSQNSKKRMFSGSGNSSSSSFVEPDLIEIPPPPTWKSKPLKQKSIVDCEVIDLDDEDPDDVVIINESIAPNAKGKKPMHSYHAGDNKVAANDGASFMSAKDMKGSSSSHVSFIDDDFDFGGMELAETFYDPECALLQAHFDNVDIPSGVEATVPWWSFSAGSGEQSSTASSSTLYGNQSNSVVDTSGVDQFQSWNLHKPLPVKKSVSKKSFYKSKLPSFGVPTKLSSYAPSIGMIPPENAWSPAPVYGPNQHVNSSYGHYPFGNNPPEWQNAFYGGPYPFLPHSTGTNATSTIFYDDDDYMLGPLGSRFRDPSVGLDDGISAQISPPISLEQGDNSENPIVKKLELFKKFDTLEDHSGHLFVNIRDSGTKSKSWVNKIADEWKMLERDLPGTIFVRVYEARMDLLRSVIVGADGTPYHDGLFFFDVNFPDSYPVKPPSVKYHAHGLRINPNLYNCGKVCLSLLGTWSGSPTENWRPGQSNMLQVLLSIQGLILNAEPYYNEPGYESSKGSQHGQKKSKHYSENTFLLSLKTMLYTMRNPPKYFEDLVFGHFYTHAHDILAACRAYLDGAEVGSFDKSKSRSPNPSPAAQLMGSNCSELLKMNLPTYIKSLVEAFTKIGVKDCEKFLVPVDNVAHQLPTQGGSSSRIKSNFFPKSKFLASAGPGHFL